MWFFLNLHINRYDFDKKNGNYKQYWGLNYYMYTLQVNNNIEPPPPKKKLKLKVKIDFFFAKIKLVIACFYETSFYKWWIKVWVKYN